MKQAIIINSDYMGKADDDLSRQLMGSFLRKLSVEENKPQKIILYHSGVKLIAEGSAVLDAVELVTKSGIDILACGTCVSYYNLADKIKAGHVSDMKTIISILMESDKVITI